MELKIEYLNKEQLKPYANNAKIHTAEQVEQIKSSIEQFGFNDPIAIWHDNEIIEGHGRLLAVMEMDGIEEVPVIRLDNLSDEERRAYMLAHNQLTMNTGFDEKILEDELMSLDADLSEFGLVLQEEYDEEPEEKPEIPFTQVLGEENNYIVLKFTDEIDWLQLQTVFGLEKVKEYSTRKDGKITKNMERYGIGRVIDGAEFLNKIGGML